MIPLVFQAGTHPGWICPQLRFCLHQLSLLAGHGTGGAWPQQSQQALSQGGKGVLLQGSCPSSTPRCLWVCWGWFYDSSSAFGTWALGSEEQSVGLAVGRVRWGQWLLPAWAVGWPSCAATGHPLHPVLPPLGRAPGLPCHEQTLSKERLFYRGFTHSE